MRSEISVKMKSNSRIKESENQTVIIYTIFSFSNYSLTNSSLSVIKLTKANYRK